MPRWTLKTGRVVRTGAIATPRHRLLAARPFIRRRAAPAECFNSDGTPMQMDGNDQYGDCTVACLGNILDVVKRILSYPGGPISDDEVIRWAIAEGDQNGAVIADVLAQLQTDPMTDGAGQGNLVGPHLGVNYDDAPTVYDALSTHYALDLGVDSRPYSQCVGNDPVAVMPILTNAYQNIDHSIPAFDYATAGRLAAHYNEKYKFAAQLGDLPMDTPCIGTETWGCMVITPVESFRNIVGEAWAIQSFPAPGTLPQPPQPPTPDPWHRCRRAFVQLLKGGMAAAKELGLEHPAAS